MRVLEAPAARAAAAAQSALQNEYKPLRVADTRAVSMAEGAPLYVVGAPANGAASGYFHTAAGNQPFPQAYYPMAAASPGAVPLMLPAGASMHGVGYVPVSLAPGGVFFVPSAHHQSQPQTQLPAPPLFFSYQQQHSLAFLPPSTAAAAAAAGALPHALAVSALSGSRTNLAAAASSPLGAHDAQMLLATTPSDAPKMARGKRTASELYGTPIWWGDSEELAASAPVAPGPSDARAAPRGAREHAAAAAAAAADEAAETSSSMSPNAERAGSGPPPKQSPSEPASRAAGGASFLVELAEPDLNLQRREEVSGAVACAEANSGISFEIDLDVGEEQPRRVRESLSQFVPSHVRKSMREREELVRSRAGRSRDAALVDSLNVTDAPQLAASRPPASPRVTPRACLAAAAKEDRVSGGPKQLSGSRAPPNVCKSMELLEMHSTHSESSAHTAGEGAGANAGAGEQTSGDKKRAHPALTSSSRALPVTPRSARTPRAVGGPNANLSSSSSRIAIKPPLMTQHAALSPRKHSRPEAHTEPTHASKANAPAASASRPATASARKAGDKAAPVKPVKLTSSQTFNRSGAQQTSSRQSAKSQSTRRQSGSATAVAESVMAAIASFPDTKSYLLDKMLAETAKKPLPATVSATRPTSRPSSASAKQQPQTQSLAQPQSQRPASRQHAGSASLAVGPKPPEFELYPEAQRFAALPVEVSGECLALHASLDEADLDEEEARSETGTYTVQQDSPDEPLESPENEEATQARLDAAIERALSNPGDEPLEQPAGHETPAAAAAPLSAPPAAGPLSSPSFPTFTRLKTGATPDALLPHIGESGNEDAERTLTAPISAFALRGTLLYRGDSPDCSLPLLTLM